METENSLHTIVSSLVVQRSSKSISQTSSERQAKAAAISTELAKLAPQYYRPDFGPPQAQALFAAFIEDLEDFAVRDVEEAMREFRRDGRNKFFPTSGQIRDLAKNIATERAKLSRPQRSIPKDPRPSFWWCLSIWKPHWRETEIPIENIRNYEIRKQKHGEPKRMA